MTIPTRYQGTELPTFAAARNWKAYIRSALAGDIRARVLEVGAGLGATTEALCNDRVSEWTCLEPDADLAAACEERVGARLGRAVVTTRVGTTADLATTDEFDSILYIDVLEHIEKDAEELERAASHLGPGGSLIVLSPANQWLFSEFDRAVGHYRRYSRATLAAAFPRTLQCERLFYADSVGAILSLANRLILHSSTPTSSQIAFWDRTVVPVSRVVDVLIRHSLGRSVIGVYRRPDVQSRD